jgi:hypothetical protein
MMKRNKNFWPGMLILALVLGTALIGCENGTNAGTNNGGNTGSVGGPADITYAVEADGTADKETSTQLTFTFSAAVSDLEVGDIEIIADTGTGAAAVNQSIRDNLTGDDTNTIWKLSITRITAGTIRLQITKDGVERGRKTVLVHQNTAPALTKDDAIKLTGGKWEDGSITEGTSRWYKFDAESGVNYSVQWKHAHDKPRGENYTASVKATAYKSDGTTIISDDWELLDFAYTYPKALSGVSGTVYLKVEIIPTYSGGTFAVRFYDQASMPQVTIVVDSARATIVPFVAVKWHVQPLSLYGGNSDDAKGTVSGFRVYRSNTETGAYNQIGEDFIFTDYQLTNIPSSDAGRVIYYDKDVIAGSSYWYKVTAYNSTGETEMSSPRQSEPVPGPTETLPLIIGAEKTEGTLKDETEVVWYTFTAEAGETYSVQWETNMDNSQNSYSVYGSIAVSVFTADKELVNFKTTYSDGSAEGYKVPGTISGVSGTVYIKINLRYVSNPYGPGGYYAGPEAGPTYSIKVSK